MLFEKWVRSIVANGNDDVDGRWEMMNKPVTVIGINEVGLATAADLTERGFAVT